MTLSAVMAALALEEARTLNVQAARARADAAKAHYETARLTLARLERLRGNESELQMARDNAQAARLELTRARRVLISNI